MQRSRRLRDDVLVSFPIIRYFNLAILLPVGCFAAFMAWEPSARLRQAIIVVFVVWGAANLADNVRTIREAYVHAQPDLHAELTESPRSSNPLCSRRFLGRVRRRFSFERAHHRRIRQYLANPAVQTRVNEHRDAAAHIEREPCAGELHVADWCIQLPVNRSGAAPR